MMIMNEVNLREKPLALSHEATLYKSYTCPKCKNVIRNASKLEDEFTCPYCETLLMNNAKYLCNEKLANR